MYATNIYKWRPLFFANVHTSIDMSPVIKWAVNTVSPLSLLVGAYDMLDYYIASAIYKATKKVVLIG